MKSTRTCPSIVLLAITLLLIPGISPVGAFEAKLSGQVNQMLMWADDGSEDDLFVTDNSNSSTRFRFTGLQDFGSVTAGFQIEMEAQRNRSSRLTLGQNNDGEFNWNDRWLNVYFDSAFGKIEIGKGSGAADGTSESDLSGTSVINSSSVSDTAGRFVFRDSDGVSTGIRVDQTRDNFDGLSRNERLRYNTPQFAGLSFSASITNGEAWEAAARYSADFAGNKVAAAVGYVDGRKREDFQQVGASLSWLMPFGLNVTGAYGLRDFDEAGKDNATNYYFKLGYKWDMHAVSVEYGWTEDLRVNGEKASNFGLAYVITPWKGIELYTSYRQYQLDRNNDPDPDDIRQAMLGTRIRF